MQLSRQVTDLIGTVTELKTRLDQTPADIHMNPPAAYATASDSQSPALTTTSNSQGRVGSFQRVLVPKQPQFVGPTRSAYSIEIGERSLTRMGIPSYEPPLLSGPQSPIGSQHHTTSLDAGFWQQCDVSEVLRLLDVFQEEVGSVYPCIDTDDLAAGASDILNWGRQRETDDLESSGNLESSGDGLCFKDFQLAKVAIATSIVVEEHGKTEHSTMMVESVERSVSRILKPTSDLKDLQLLVILVRVNVGP